MRVATAGLSFDDGDKVVMASNDGGFDGDGDDEDGLVIQRR